VRGGGGLGHAQLVGDEDHADAVVHEVSVALGREIRDGVAEPFEDLQAYPGAGISEDPATGSAAGPLAIHLARHGRIGFGEQIEIRQGAEIGRPSVLYATVTGEGDRIDSVEVGGAALIVAEGRFRVAWA